ncbi:LysR family transcriptional regulator [Microbacterium sp.]|uniref:LysR family transcriptional regulator n=1 Tax=Microbacterium sp. TaxID=51671 RepID=UPI002812217A|nr:LysR family transcriptional regulator [Microbacterium sp.]
MTITQLTAFLAALEHGSFTAAATNLRMTQASVSELVGRLERELGVTLFTRGSRRLVPTAAALELRPHANQAVSAVQNGIDTISALNSLDRGTCTFGVLRNAAYYALADLAETFHLRYPNVRLRLVGINSAHVARSIASGELEAGLLVLPVDEDGLEVRPLFRDEVLYASAARPADAGPVTIDEIAAAKLVLYDAFAGWDDPTRRQLLERARLRGLTIDPAIEVENVETALDLVAAGTADTVVSRSIAESEGFPSGIRTFSFAEPVHDTIALVRREGMLLSPATHRLAELAEQMLRERLPEHRGRIPLQERPPSPNQ